MATICGITARQILDSRGKPTLEVTLTTQRAAFTASVPSGASKGAYEALELRDGGARWMGLGVQRAITSVRYISKRLRGKPLTLRGIDETIIALDGTPNKSRLGANALLGVSIAAARACAHEEGVALWCFLAREARTRPKMPALALNVINGGAHAGTRLAFQEYLIVPIAARFDEALRVGCEAYAALKDVLVQRFGKAAINVGDEGGFAPPLARAAAPLPLLELALEGANANALIGIDAAAEQFFDARTARYRVNSRLISVRALSDYYTTLAEMGLAYLEDPFTSRDTAAWCALRARLKRVLIVGDDLTATQAARIRAAAEQGACNAIILKPNQVGTLSEAIEAAQVARAAGLMLVTSHRSGETCDDWIADFAVALGCEAFKAGAPARGERVAKMNRLLVISRRVRAFAAPTLSRALRCGRRAQCLHAAATAASFSPA